MFTEEFTVPTPRKICLVPITRQIEIILQKMPSLSGLLNIYLPHTTAGLVINENADPSVSADLEKAFSSMVPPVNFSHMEGNSPAHILSSLTGCSLVVPVENGKLLLGTWQGIFLAEFDGPRQRKVRLTFIKG